MPAAALIYLNFSQLHAFKRDKVLEAAIHRDFQEMLAITEKRINAKTYAMAEEARSLFPSPDADPAERIKKLDLLLAKSPWLTHVLLFDEKGAVVRSQPHLAGDKYVIAEQERMVEGYRGWFGKEGKMMVESMLKKPRPMSIYTEQTKRAEGRAYMATAYFVPPNLSSERVVMGGVCFDLGLPEGNSVSGNDRGNGKAKVDRSGQKPTCHDRLSSEHG